MSVSENFRDVRESLAQLNGWIHRLEDRFESLHKCRNCEQTAHGHSWALRQPGSKYLVGGTEKPSPYVFCCLHCGMLVRVTDPNDFTERQKEILRFHGLHVPGETEWLYVGMGGEDSDAPHSVGPDDSPEKAPAVGPMMDPAEKPVG